MNLIFSISKIKLLNKLKIICGIIKSKRLIPILSNILLKKKKNKIFLISSNIEMQIKVYIKLKEYFKDELFTTFSSKKFISIIKSLANNFDIYIYMKKKGIYIISGNSKFYIRTLSYKNFPYLKKKKYNKFLIMKQKNFKYILSMVYFSMGEKNIINYLNGLLFIIKNNKISLISTDNYRLSICSINIKKNILKYKIIIPRKTIIELLSLLKNTDKNISIFFSENQIKFKFSKIELISKIIIGKFPDYKDIMIDNYKYKFKIEKDVLLNSLKRVSIIANEKFKGVNFKIYKNNLNISSYNLIKEKVTECIKINFFKKKLNISFNIKYLIDVLKNIKDSYVNFCIKNSKSPILISIDSDKKFKYLLMPMQI